MKMKQNESNDELFGIKMAYPQTTLLQILENKVSEFPDAIALKYRDEEIKYSELQDKINKMAQYFWSEGLRPEQVVGICLERTPDLIVGLFAILQCGAAYLPLDPKFPKSRLEFMINDSEASFLLTDKEHLNTLPALKNTLLIEEALTFGNINTQAPKYSNEDAASIAYIMYTSGSTGKPKGVTITHKNLLNFLYSMAEMPGINKNDRLLSITTISFDIAGLELFLPLITGATVVLADYESTRDDNLVLKLLEQEKITILQATPTTWQMLLDAGWKNKLPLKALCGGEAMPLNLARNLTAKCDELWNMYGPTETTIWSAIKQIHADDDLITIGKPIANTQIYILDEKGQTVSQGTVGEIVIGGDGVAQGYWNRPELTAEKFIPNPNSKAQNNVIYRTGDLGKVLPDGNVQCLGRIDQQIKLRGHRIELGEIEAVLNGIAGIQQAAVIVNSTLGNDAKLVAYLKSKQGSQDTNSISKQLEEILPDILLPSIYVWVEEFPTTPNGKIDKKNLPQPEYVRPNSAPPLKLPSTKLEKDIANIWSEQLQIPTIGINDNFFDSGGTSILAQKLSSLLLDRLALNVPVSKIYNHPTISELCEFLAVNKTAEHTFVFKNSKNNIAATDIAIIGMAGRFPGAETIEELWEVLRDGKETITFFTKEELDSSIPDYIRNNPLYVTARGILPSAATFDAAFFGLNPQVAKAMDPQIRLFLEIAWEVLEQTGHLPKHYKGSIGVYSGSEFNTYYENNVLLNRELQEQVGNLQVYTVNGKDFIAPRTSYHLNLKGPAVSVHSACSTSLLAVAEAVTAIRTGQCDVALAGGSSVTAPIYSGHPYDEGFIKNPDGRTRPFDASGKGTVFSDGAGVVLLKSLEAAKKEGDTIYGIIKGVGVNNDGGDKGSFMAPSSQGQAGAIINALNDAKISPASISYLEAHGTATLVGDPIEIEGLKLAYGKQDQNQYCAIGSIKSNFGHTTAAAGVAGLIKTVLSMQHKKLTPMVGFKTPNPNIDFKNSPFYVNATLKDWNSNGPRRAGVSSFGIGSTNVHVIVEEYENTPVPTTVGRPAQLLTWSAKNDISLAGYQNALGNFITNSPDSTLADIAYTLQVTREEFNHRSFLVADSNSDATKNLLASETSNTKSKILKVTPSEMGFLFPGQGSQYLQMGKTLYDNETVYRDAIDTCAELLKADLKLDIRDIIFPESNTPEAEKLLKNTFYTQPALFITEYALAQLWMSWGIKPTLLCGHSVGEFVAAHLAGVFSLKDALKVIATRSRLVSELPGGSMLSVRLPEEQLKELLPKTLSIAAVNSKQLSVVSGTYEAIEAFAKIMESKDIPHKVLFTSHAFHSTMMDPMLDSFKEALKKVTLNIPRLPIISTVTGTWLTDSEATNVDYWVGHVKNTVRFADAMNTILDQENFVLLEVGPGKSLTSLAQQQAAGKIISAFNSLTMTDEGNYNEYTSVLNALGNLWTRGINPDWNAFYKTQKRQKINLPSYVFDRKPCWANPILFNGLPVGEQPIVTNTIAQTEPAVVESLGAKTTDKSRVSVLLDQILDIITHASGISFDLDAVSNTFLELGLDSLTLTQLSGRLKKEFNLPITFRQLNEEFATPALLANYLDANLPEEKPAKPIETPMQPSINNGAHVSTSDMPSTSGKQQMTLEQIVEQLALLNKHVGAIQNYLNAPLNGTGSISKHPGASTRFNSSSKDQLIETNKAAEDTKPFEDVQNKDVFADNQQAKKEYTILPDSAPLPGARLGRDEAGNPAWFITDTNKKGHYIKINL